MAKDKNQQMQVPKYYAVVRGKHPGIYRSQRDALNQINGFDHPDMQVFNSEYDAIQYFNRDNGPGKDFTIPAEQVVLPSGTYTNEDLGKFNETSDFVVVHGGAVDSDNDTQKQTVPDQIDVTAIAKNTKAVSKDTKFKPDVTCLIAGLDNGFWGYGIIDEKGQNICDSSVNIGVPAIGLEQIALSSLLEQLYILGKKDLKIEIAVMHKDMLKVLDLGNVNDVPGLSPSKHNYIKKQLANFNVVHMTVENAAVNSKAVDSIKNMLNLPNQLAALNNKH